MEYYTKNFPVPSDYFGILWALSGIKNAIIIEHGSAGNTSYNVMSYNVMNRQTPQGRLFSSGLDQEDVIIGKEDKLVKVIHELDQRFKPEVIFLVATSVTGVIGLDLEGIIYEIQAQVQAQLIAFPSGGFCGNYQWGIKKVYQQLFEKVMVPAAAHEDGLVNIIGPTIDSFNYQSDLAEIKRLLGLMKLRVQTVFTAETSIEEIRNMPRASLNLVIRDLGVELAQKMEQSFGIPYVYGMPFGIEGTIGWLKKISAAINQTFELEQVRCDVLRYGLTLKEALTSGQRINDLKIIIACPFDYAWGLSDLIDRQWGLQIDTVVLPIRPEIIDGEAQLLNNRVKQVFNEPDHEKLAQLYQAESFDLLFGNYHQIKMAERVPIKIHAAFPSFDYLTIYDGTPFTGFRGSAYLTQVLANAVNQHREVIR